MLFLTFYLSAKITIDEKQYKIPFINGIGFETIWSFQK